MMTDAIPTPGPAWPKKVILFLASQGLSLFGSALVQHAMLWYITLTAQSGSIMTIYILCGFLPTFILSPVAGVWADRYPRKTLIILADALIAAATLLLAFLFGRGHNSLWLLCGMAAVRAVGSGIQAPAVGAILPQLVPAEQLTRVNGVNASIQSFIMLVSPMASGALLSVASLPAIFLVDVATAVIAIGILLGYLVVPVHAGAKAAPAAGYFSDLRAGLVYIRGHAFLKQFFTHQALFCVLIAPAAFLTPLFVARRFGEEVWRLSANEVIYAAGTLAGGVFLTMWGGFRNRVHTIAAAYLIVGAGTLALGAATNFGLYLAAMAVVGVALPFFNTPFTVLIQEKVEGAYLGRVFGVLLMVSTAMMPLGMLVFGPAADLIPVEWLLLGTGLLMVLQGWFLRRSPVLLAAGEPAAPPEA